MVMFAVVSKGIFLVIKTDGVGAPAPTPDYAKAVLTRGRTIGICCGKVELNRND
jgi:hypothetical protein